MWIQNIVQEACPICGKEPTLAVIEPHTTHPEMEPIHIDVWIAALLSCFVLRWSRGPLPLFWLLRSCACNN
jgi:hypothetical protein